MITLIIASEKGGTTKTTTACQLAWYGRALNLKILLVDVDHQGNATRAMERAKENGLDAPTRSRFLSAQVFATKVKDIEKEDFLYLPASVHLKSLEMQGAEQHEMYEQNVIHFHDQVKDHYDLVIYDTNPNPDIRVLAPVTHADYILVPMTPTQEAVDNLSTLVESIRLYKRKNAQLKLLGILLNAVEMNNFQRELVQAMSEVVGPYIFKKPDGSPALIPKRVAFMEAQAGGYPFGEYFKSRADFKHIVEPIFQKIYQDMGLI